MSCKYKCSNDIDPDDYVPATRQVELVNIAPVYPFNAVRLAIREAVFAALTTTFVEIEVCDGSCIVTHAGVDMSLQCESCADLAMRIELGIIPDIHQGDES